MRTFFMIVGIISSLIVVSVVVMVVVVFAHKDARDAYSCAVDHPDWSRQKVEKYCVNKDN